MGSITPSGDEIEPCSSQSSIGEPSTTTATQTIAPSARQLPQTTAPPGDQFSQSTTSSGGNQPESSKSNDNITSHRDVAVPTDQSKFQDYMMSN